MSLIKVDEAREIILSRIQYMGAEKIPLTETLGRVLCEDIIARRNNPPMDNSAMDGYALIAEDVKTASPENPVPLQVVGEVAAGYTAQGESLKSGQALRIMTGAPIPPGANAVIMQEDTERDGDRLLVKDMAEVDENIREAGEDVKVGEVVVPKGTLIRPAHIGMMATVGRSQIFVGRRPTVAVLSTGDEILDLDDQPEGPCIYNSNGYMLSAQIRSAGGVPHYLGIARDTEEDLMEKFQWALQCDLIVSSGGVSVGDYDLVKSSLKKIGQEMLFWKVAMKPGKPLAFGQIGDTPIFGLPGNPVSSFVSFEQFARPAIRKMTGRADLLNASVQAKLTHSVTKKAGRQHFLSARTVWENDGYIVTPEGAQGSGILKSAAHANSLMVFPLEATELAVGAQVTVQLLE